MTSKTQGDIDTAAQILTMLGNEKRLHIMRHLLEDEFCVGDLSEAVELSQSALSQHLAKLRTNKLVETRRDRQLIYYRCDSPVVKAIMDVLENYYDMTEDQAHTQKVETLHTARNTKSDLDEAPRKRPGVRG
ncbi:ArsR/SmtB family transcription factor [Limoniibacter endophyticus]|uniref:Transcriptional regulator n=1 Tax=Limoniibacter endophyticus TaxID=1565040 RepID=A0A8J3DGS5_9HYPH|nr:metalloregulator ArsR/SmtB family transcription factor [Limoniibacter endophyticus]GHC65349.1 transcriptional regulator [Limoniibacter endophyticus]